MSFWERAKKIVKRVEGFLEALYRIESTEAAERPFEQVIEKPHPDPVDRGKEDNS